MIDATAIILTKNESPNIQSCIGSLQGFAKRVVVVDCGSTDDTVKLAKSSGADVYFHEFEYYSRQFNWGIENTDIDTEWIIRIDADEQFPKGLCLEIEKFIEQYKQQPMNGIGIAAELFFLGKKLKHLRYNKRKMMVFKRACGHIEDRRRDAHSVITEGFSVGVKHKYIHRDYKDVGHYIRRYEWYTTREMQDYFDYVNGSSVQIKTDKTIQRIRKKKFGIYYQAPRYIRAWMWFIYNYIFRLGFLDGVPGFLFCFFEFYWYRLLVDAKIYEHEQTGSVFGALSAL